MLYIYSIYIIYIYIYIQWDGQYRGYTKYIFDIYIYIIYIYIYSGTADIAVRGWRWRAKRATGTRGVLGEPSPLSTKIYI